jgi:MFS family permease
MGQADHDVAVPFRYNTVNLFLVLLMACFGVMGFFLVTALIPSFLMDLTHIPAHLALTTHTVNMVVLAGVILLGGFLGDTYSRAPLMLGCCCISAVLAYPIWLLFTLENAGVSWFAEFVLVVLVGLFLGAGASLTVEAFPKGVSCWLEIQQ